MNHFEGDVLQHNNLGGYVICFSGIRRINIDHESQTRLPELFRLCPYLPNQHWLDCSTSLHLVYGL